MTDIFSELENSKILQPIIMVSGTPGAGKTEFCSEAPDNLWIPIESTGLGARVLPNIVPEKYTKKYRNLVNFLKSVRDNKETGKRFKSVTLDSITALYKLIQDDIFDIAETTSKTHIRPTSINSNNHSELSYKNGEKQEVPSRYVEIMNLLTEIRDIHNVRIHIIAHTKLAKDKSSVLSGLENYAVMPNLQNEYSTDLVLGACDFNIVIDDMVTEKNNLDKLGTKKILAAKTKVLRINDPRCSCKSRAGYLNYDIIDEDDNIKNKEGDLLSIHELPIQEKNGYAIFDYLLIKDIQILNKKNDNKKNEEK